MVECDLRLKGYWFETYLRQCVVSFIFSFILGQPRTKTANRYQLQAKVCERSTQVNCLFMLAKEKSVIRRTDSPDMTIAVY